MDFKEIDLEDDVVNVMKERYLSFEEKCKAYDVRCSAEAGRIAPILDPYSVRRCHRKGYWDWKMASSGKSLFFKTSYTNKAIFSASPFKDLKRTRIRELRINIPSKGFYLLARTVEPPIMEVGMSTIIEDHTGDVFTFSLYNFLDPDSSLGPEDVLPVGTIFVLKEPLLKSAVTGHIIRCDTPTDIIILYKHSKLYHLAETVSWKNDILKEESKDPTNKEEWKNFGNEMFQNGLYSKAVESYFMALKHTDDNDTAMVKTLYSNISMTYLKLECYEDALSSAKKVLERDPKHTKALYRAGRAQYELRQYEEAESYFKNIVKREPENKVVIEQLSRCASRIEEQNGKIDINQLYWAQSENPNTELDCADYVGPIKVVPVPGKGRGVVAKEDIKTGTLLCVCKAIKATFENPAYGITMQLADGKNEVSTEEQVRLVTKLVQCVMKNPNVLGTKIYDLSTGNNCRPEAKLFCNEKTKGEPIVDVQRIRDIVSCNSFSLNNLNTTREETTSGAGIFMMPSYMNHSCIPNATWYVYNDVMVVYAVADISCGQEITIAYVSTLVPFPVREAILKKRYFHCVCFLCELDRSESSDIHRKRDALLGQFRIQISQNANNDSELVRDIQGIIAKLEKTYKQSNRCQLKTYLLEPYMRLPGLYLKRSNVDLLMETLEKALNCLGLTSEDLLQFAEHKKTITKTYLMTYEILFISKVMARACYICEKPLDFEKWLNVLLAMREMFSGVKRETDRERIAKDIRLWALPLHKI